MVKITAMPGITVDGKNYENRREEREFSFTQPVETIKLLNCSFDGFPAGLLEHKDVSSLSFNRCKFALGELPEEIEIFAGLNTLSITECGLREFPTVITHLKTIQELYMGNSRKCPSPLKNIFGSIPKDLAQLSNLKHLDLPWCRLDRYPRVISELTNLETVNLHGNSNIESLPAGALKNLPNLEHLDVTYCGLTVCPDFSTGSDRLKRLDMGQNDIECLSNTIANLTNLSHLDISVCEFTSFPEILTGITTLIHLNISGNDIEKLPSSIVKLQRLRYFDASNCSLTKCPSCIGNLKSLTCLNLSENDIEKLPSSLLELTKLEELLLVNCNIKHPEVCAKISSYAKIDMTHNPVSSSNI